ncbi:hypothetical protein M9B40_00320 [SAR86 cluster bacterium]|uniref:Surface-adhesin protein E-like domain-containing protein n=1 Tax=SAR86 cluster bacterium TaxID=2030880 RepID=A0A9Q8TYN8_9GAMM|nr:hypothetical protein M9B40_00320 [SAR86 cluster bacterium]
MFSPTSFADWTMVSKSETGRIYYVDLERIRKVDGFIYFWQMSDYLIKDKYGDLSNKVYIKADCELFRYQNLKFYFHKEPMARGDAEIEDSEDLSWNYATPNSNIEAALITVCSQ